MTTTRSIDGKMPKGRSWNKNAHGKEHTENQHKKPSKYNHRNDGYPFAKNKQWNKKKGEFIEIKEPGGIRVNMNINDLKKGAILYPTMKGFHQGLWKITKITKKKAYIIPVKELETEWKPNKDWWDWIESEEIICPKEFVVRYFRIAYPEEIFEELI